MEHTFQIIRKFDRWAYPKNGNLHNPTPYFRWESYVDGECVCSHDPSLARARALLRDYFGAETVTVTREPLPANPYSQASR